MREADVFGSFFHLTKSKGLALLGYTGVMLISLFCVIFLLTSYDRLSNWYINLGQTFYRSQFWRVDFFTPETKKTGDLFCIAGLLVCVILLTFLYRRTQQEKIKPALNHRNWLPSTFLIVFGLAAWLCGNSLVKPAFDEVFSAVNCAALPPFQTLSYYMLPNNHLLFNLLNGLFFHFVADKVFTGRLISLGCYLSLIVLVFNWLSTLLKNSFEAAAVALVLMLQFPVWGFAFQARGYELCTLAAWLAFFALSRYSLFNKAPWMNIYVAACLTGYWCIPAFLYFHVACMIFGSISISRKNANSAIFWKAQFIVVLLVFLVYLPALCFSGLPAFIANQYVRPQEQSLQTFGQGFRIIFTGYLDYFSTGLIFGKNISGGLLFLLPLALFRFYRSQPALMLGKFYISMWVSWLMVAGIMRIFPPDRIMAGQLSISLAISCYTIYLLLEGAIRKTAIRRVIMAVFLMILAFLFGRSDLRDINYGLYQNDINGNFARIDRAIGLIPRTKSIGFSDECFYWRYLYLKRRGTIAENEPSAPQYYIRSTSDPLPVKYRIYVLKSTVDDYQVYEKPGI